MIAPQASSPSKLIVLNNSDHRMSSNLDLKLLEQVIKNMIKGIL